MLFCLMYPTNYDDQARTVVDDTLVVKFDFESYRSKLWINAINDLRSLLAYSVKEANSCNRVLTFTVVSEDSCTVAYGLRVGCRVIDNNVVSCRGLTLIKL